MRVRTNRNTYYLLHKIPVVAFAHPYLKLMRLTCLVPVSIVVLFRGILCTGEVRLDRPSSTYDTCRVSEYKFD